MLHTKFQGNLPSGSGVEDFLRFLSIRALQLSWSCDLDEIYKVSFPFCQKAAYEI